MIEIRCKDDLLKCLRNELAPCNPYIAETGIEGLLKYRLLKNVRHPDSLYKGYDSTRGAYYGESYLPKCFEDLYHVDAIHDRNLGSTDTIFNAWSFTRYFACGINQDITPYHVNQHLDIIFSDYNEIRILLDKLSDLHHSLANFMPAPKGFNYVPGSNPAGKGSYENDNDMPDLFYSRVQENDNGAGRFSEWIKKYREPFCLEFFDEYKSSLHLGYADFTGSAYAPLTKDAIPAFVNDLKNAIDAIESRASLLWSKNLQERGFLVTDDGELTTL